MAAIVTRESRDSHHRFGRGGGGSGLAARGVYGHPDSGADGGVVKVYFVLRPSLPSLQATLVN